MMEVMSIRIRRRWRLLQFSFLILSMVFGLIQVKASFQQTNNIFHRHHFEFFTNNINNDEFKNSVRLSSQQTEEETISATTAKTKTDGVSITLPRFFAAEIEDGTYPSPLHTIHIRNILSNDEASQCLQLAAGYAQRTGCWDQPDLDRHVTYSTCDFPVEENVELMEYLHKIDFNQRLWGTLEELYNVNRNDMSYLDFFCAHYQGREQQQDKEEEVKKTMDRLEAHRDGSLLSFTILLNSPTEFSGGGTFFDGLRDVTGIFFKNNSNVLESGGVIRPLHAGDGCFHCGKILHGADVVTSGNRTVLVGFVDVSELVQRPGALSKACRDWGRMDVATWRYKRQLEKCNSSDGKIQHQQLPGWFLNNARWIHTDPNNGRGRSCIQGFVPAFESVERRADPEYQRQRKLEAEDCLLRSILLNENESPCSSSYPGMELFDGDITIL